MKANELKQALTVAIAAGRPTMTWGAPGIGKSEIHDQVGKALGFDSVIKLDGVLLDVVDLRGVPVPVVQDRPLFQFQGEALNGSCRTKWFPPEFLPVSGRHLIFIDEISQAVPLVMNGLAQLILERRLGDYRLPDGCHVCAAGNRMEDRAATHRMPSQLVGRLVHLDFEADQESWVQWAIGAGVSFDVVAFLRLRPELLHVFKAELAHKPFPSPRGWKFVSDILGAYSLPSVGPVDKTGALISSLLTGCIGEGAAIEFLAFLDTYKHLPSWERIVADPRGTEVPEKGNTSAMYALSGMLTHKASSVTLGPILQYLHRLPKEFEVMAVLDMIRGPRKGEISETTDFIKWSSKNTALFTG